MCFLEFEGKLRIMPEDSCLSHPRVRSCGHLPAVIEQRERELHWKQVMLYCSMCTYMFSHTCFPNVFRKVMKLSLIEAEHRAH